MQCHCSPISLRHENATGASELQPPAAPVSQTAVVAPPPPSTAAKIADRPLLLAAVIGIPVPLSVCLLVGGYRLRRRMRARQEKLVVKTATKRLMSKRLVSTLLQPQPTTTLPEGLRKTSSRVIVTILDAAGDALNAAAGASERLSPRVAGAMRSFRALHAGEQYTTLGGDHKVDMENEAHSSAVPGKTNSRLWREMPRLATEEPPRAGSAGGLRSNSRKSPRTRRSGLLAELGDAGLLVGTATQSAPPPAPAAEKVVAPQTKGIAHRLLRIFGWGSNDA